jgi:coproporphyrinogen III oxidase-like Fe-S oxidoreductase
MLGMRLASGIDVSEFERLFGASFDAEYGKKLSKYAPEYVTYDGKTCKFTDKGMFVSNFILSDALDFDA